MPDFQTVSNAVKFVQLSSCIHQRNTEGLHVYLYCHQPQISMYCVNFFLYTYNTTCRLVTCYEYSACFLDRLTTYRETKCYHGREGERNRADERGRGTPTEQICGHEIQGSQGGRRGEYQTCTVDYDLQIKLQRNVC